jgi:hypothetical protein
MEKRGISDFELGILNWELDTGCTSAAHGWDGLGKRISDFGLQIFEFGFGKGLPISYWPSSSEM